MTYTESASAMRRLAEVMDKVVKDMGYDSETGHPKPMLEDGAAVGAAVMLCYLRDLLTTGEREHYDRGTLLVVLETISRDSEIFPCGIAKLMWAAEPEEE